MKKCLSIIPKSNGINIRELDASVLERIPVRTNYDDRYFSDKYQALPKGGYTQLFEKILSHPNITVLLETDYFDEVRGSSESLAGLLLELFSRLPRAGEIATHREVTFKVQSADKKRIKKVRVLVSEK